MAASNAFVSVNNNYITQPGATATGANAVALGSGAVAQGANTVAVGNNAVATGDNSVALGARSIADRPNTVSVGSPGNERQITNVAPGVAPTDAVNMMQLNNLRTEAYRGIAGSNAIATLGRLNRDEVAGLGVAIGGYGGQTAIAVGMEARVLDNLRVNAAVSVSPGSGGQVGFGIGAFTSWK